MITISIEFVKKKSKNTNELQEIQISLPWRKVLLAAGLIFIGLFFWHKIIFINADLGRHIKNGEVILSDFSIQNPVFATNFYSYTEPDFPLINHHWGSGVIFYFLWKLFGFSGLSLFNVLINVTTVFLFFRIAEKRAGFVFAFLCLILSVPLVASRTEIRPEAFSYLFMGIFYYFITLFDEKKISFIKMLFILLPLQLLWVNLHLFFIIGIFIAGIYWVNAFFKKQYFREFSILLFSEIMLSLINPNGVTGFIEPFMILREYGYMIAENQSIFFMHKRFPGNRMYYHFEILFGISLMLFLYRFYTKRTVQYNPHFVLFLFFSVISVKMIRGIPLWGLFFIPFAASSLKLMKGDYFSYKAGRLFQVVCLVVPVIIMFSGFSSKNHYYSPFKGITGLGLIENINRSAAFIKKNKISGPFFNNYDIGGYFIFNFFPEQRLFVDNRPEAYSVDFFKNVYEPMQEREEKWIEFSNKFDFNCIYFFRHDNTTHAQPFLIRRTNDEKWAPVFVDDFTIIFLKRNEKNSELIKKYELPKSIFSAVPQ